MFYSLTGGPKTGWSQTTRRRARRLRCAKKFFYWLKLDIDMAAFDWPRGNMKDFGGPFSFCF